MINFFFKKICIMYLHAVCSVDWLLSFAIFDHPLLRKWLLRFHEIRLQSQWSDEIALLARNFKRVFKNLLG